MDTKLARRPLRFRGRLEAVFPFLRPLFGVIAPIDRLETLTDLVEFFSHPYLPRYFEVMRRARERAAGTPNSFERGALSISDVDVMCGVLTEVCGEEVLGACEALERVVTKANSAAFDLNQVLPDPQNFVVELQGLDRAAAHLERQGGRRAELADADSFAGLASALLAILVVTRSHVERFEVVIRDREPGLRPSELVARALRAWNVFQ